jgi:hypothetical protein
MGDDGHRRAELTESAISAAFALQSAIAPGLAGPPANDTTIQQADPTAIVQEVSPADTDVAPWFTAPGSVDDLVEQLADDKATRDREQMERGLEGLTEAEYADHGDPPPEAADYWNDVAQGAPAGDEGWADAAPASDAGLWPDGGAPADGGFDAGPGGLF